MKFEHRYESKETRDPTKEYVENKLKDYEKIAGAHILFNGKGSFAVLITSANDVSELGRSKEEFDSVFRNTLIDGSEKLCDYLKECYAEGLKNLEDEFIRFLKKEGVI